MADGISSSPPAHRPTVLFDKDGTLIEDVPYNVDPALIRFAPGTAAALGRLAAAGFAAAVVTNQSGVARGYFSLGDLEPVRERLAEMLGALGVPLAGFYACPHLPRGTVPEFAVVCECRKPAAGLVWRAIAELGLDAPTTWLVGDTWADVAAGRAAGCRTILVGREWQLASTLPPLRQPDAAAPDLSAAVDVILDSTDAAAVAGARVAEHGVAAAAPREAVEALSPERLGDVASPQA